ncbi:MAG: transketolase C-terminal domain-containing protein [Dethiobacteria bacterium]|nr:pyruvate ferredoxin oxidoreductase [Bacillota bacterium]
MRGGKEFLSGNEAVALGVKLSRPHVIAAYPITPQTIAVERLSDYVEDGSLKAEYIHVESEHSAMSALIGACAVGARTFTATSSQGLLYMSECLHYASGSRFPIVMMNANRSLAVPWNIFGDQRDSLSLLDSGWIQEYVENAQEALDMVIQAYRIAEDNEVLTPFMINLDGFVLTHTYELVDVPQQEEVDDFLPPFSTPVKMDLQEPKSLCITAGPPWNMEFKYQQHQAMLKAKEKIETVDADYAERFGRSYGGLVEEYRTDDAEAILFTLGSVTGTARVVVDKLREEGQKVGLVKLRYLRPFPEEEVLAIAKKAKIIGVLEKNISSGYEGTVFTNVNSALAKAEQHTPAINFIAGLGGRPISKENIVEMFQKLFAGLEDGIVNRVYFVGMGCEIDD